MTVYVIYVPNVLIASRRCSTVYFYFYWYELFTLLRSRMNDHFGAVFQKWKNGIIICMRLLVWLAIGDFQSLLHVLAPTIHSLSIMQMKLIQGRPDKFASGLEEWKYSLELIRFDFVTEMRSVFFQFQLAGADFNEILHGNMMQFESTAICFHVQPYSAVRFSAFVWTLRRILLYQKKCPYRISTDRVEKKKK